MWKKIVCFTTEESPLYPGKWVIRPIHDNFHLEHTEGSFNLIMARLFNLSYAQYLRFCRDICGAEIYGKNKKYPVAYFQKTAVLDQLVRLLNNRANLVLWERENPDWEQHQVELLSKQKLVNEARVPHFGANAKEGTNVSN